MRAMTDTNAADSVPSGVYEEVAEGEGEVGLARPGFTPPGGVVVHPEDREGYAGEEGGEGDLEEQDMIWDAPPAPGERRPQGGAHTWAAKLMPLTEKPGVWVMVRKFDHTKGAERMLSNMSSGRTNIPEGLWEMASRRDSAAGVSRLHIRYLGREGELYQPGEQLHGSLVDRTRGQTFNPRGAATRGRPKGSGATPPVAVPEQVEVVPPEDAAPAVTEEDVPLTPPMA